MLTLVPKNWISWDFRVLVDGLEVALIDRHWFREAASFRVGGRPFNIRRTSVVRGTFVLEHAGVVLAEAAKPSAFRRSFDVRAAGDQFHLSAVNAFSRAFELSRAGTVVGTIRPQSWPSRTAKADLPDALSREIQLFIVFLALVLWKRQADAA